MPSYNEIRKGCARSKYARGGRVGKDAKTGRTVINIVVPPASGTPAPAQAAPAPAPLPPSGGAPVPPQAAAMALNQMQGKPGMPGAFARGGRVTAPKPRPSTRKAGAGSGVGRLQKERRP